MILKPAIPAVLAGFLLLCVAPANHNIVKADWIDPDTPEDAFMTQPFTVVPGPIPPANNTKKHNHTKAPLTEAPSNEPTTSPSVYPTAIPDTFELVFSEEFNVPSRSFEDGADPRWTAMEKNDYTNDALHYYAASNGVTDDKGNLVITTEATDTKVVGFDDVKQKKTTVTKHFRSAMLQTWNKFCFTGGIIEAEVELPGQHNIGGLWPAFWLLGNMARHTYVGSSEHIWPWSSKVCTQRSFDAQKISGCDRYAHFGLEMGVGRGSPEIDIFEVQPGPMKANTGVFLRTSVGQPFMSASFQVAPGRADTRPGPGYWPGPGQWYDGLVGGKNSSLNIGFYGTYNHFAHDPNPAKADYWSDAISYNRQLEAKHFKGPHTYRLEWDVPTDEKDGYLRWFLDGELIVAMNGTGIRDAGTGSEVSTEPSYILLNTAVSSQWGFPLVCPDNCPCKKYNCHSKQYTETCGFSDGFCDMMTKEGDPPQYKVNYVRVYQNPNLPEQKVGCSTPERPTRRYIEANDKLYKSKDDKHPLKPVVSGGGQCDHRATDESRKSCGGAKRGHCNRKNLCECEQGWTGPHCLASVAFNKVEWDPPDTIADVGFIPPQFFPEVLVIGLVVMVVVLLVSMFCKPRLSQWTPIPDVDAKYVS